MSEFKDRESLRDTIRNWIEVHFGCFPNEGLMYKLYENLAGSIYCMCCLFWRGVLLGALSVGALALLAYLIGRYT